MSEPKPFASLSSGLLARKGAARPAMRPQGFGQVGNGLEDLGWNDMGADPPKAVPASGNGDNDSFGDAIVEHPRAYHPTGLSPVESPVHGQQAEIADRLAPAGEDDIDEDFDETAELYNPDAPFVASEDDGTDEDDCEEGGESPAQLPAAFKVASAEAPVASRKTMALEAPADHWADPQPEPVALQSVVADQSSKTMAETAAATSRAAPEDPATATARSRGAKPRSAPRLKGKAAFTLRLDPERHLKLRLACAVNGCSAQMLVTDALDQLLAAMPELHEMAEKANRKG